MLEVLHLSAAKGEVARQLVGEPEGDGEADLEPEPDSQPQASSSSHPVPSHVSCLTSDRGNWVFLTWGRVA